MHANEAREQPRRRGQWLRPRWRVTSRTDDGDGVLRRRQRVVSKSWWRHRRWRHRVVCGWVGSRRIGLRRRVCRRRGRARGHRRRRTFHEAINHSNMCFSFCFSPLVFYTIGQNNNNDNITVSWEHKLRTAINVSSQVQSSRSNTPIFIRLTIRTMIHHRIKLHRIVTSSFQLINNVLWRLKVKLKCGDGQNVFLNSHFLQFPCSWLPFLATSIPTVCSYSYSNGIPTGLFSFYSQTCVTKQ